MEDSKKRRIPRHVDGRIMIGRMYWKNFIFKFMPLTILTVIFLFSKLTPVTLFLAVVVIGFFYFIFSEINNRETGMDIFKDYLRYKKQGTLIYERSSKYATVDTGRARDKGKQEKKQNTN